MRRRVLLAVSFLFALGLALFCRPFGAIDRWPFGPISPLSYYRIRGGMTKAQVQDIIGLPPGIHRHREPLTTLEYGNVGIYVAEAGLRHDQLPDLWPGESGVMHDGRAVTLEQWWGENYAIRIVFDADDKVVWRCLIRIEWGKEPREE